MPTSKIEKQGKRKLSFWTTPAVRKELRLLAAKEDTTQQDLITEALNLLFTSKGLPPVK